MGSQTSASLPLNGLIDGLVQPKPLIGNERSTVQKVVRRTKHWIEATCFELKPAVVMEQIPDAMQQQPDADHNRRVSKSSHRDCHEGERDNRLDQDLATTTLGDGHSDIDSGNDQQDHEVPQRRINSRQQLDDGEREYRKNKRC